MKLFVASIYHLVDENEHEEFNNILSVILSSIPKSAEFIREHGINVNVKKKKKMYRKALGGWYVVVQKEEEPVYIPGGRAMRLLLHKIADLRWLQLLWWGLILSTFSCLYAVLVIDCRVQCLFFGMVECRNNPSNSMYGSNFIFL